MQDSRQDGKGSTTAPWWTSSFPDVLASREAFPGPEKWQTSYVRYRRSMDAQVSATGWDLSSSIKSYQQVARSEQVFLPEDHLLFSPAAPYAINMKIIEVPAEFVVPVKQDRRLSPHFKVRVEVKYKGAVMMPLTVRAHIISQQEKDSVLAWDPDHVVDDRTQRIVGSSELKGTTAVTHHFEAGSLESVTTSVRSHSNSRTSHINNAHNVELGALQVLNGRAQATFGSEVEHNMRAIENRLMAAETAMNLGTMFSNQHGMPACTLGGPDASVDSLLSDYPSLRMLDHPQAQDMHALHLTLGRAAGRDAITSNSMLLSLFGDQQQKAAAAATAARGGMGGGGGYAGNGMLQVQQAALQQLTAGASHGIIGPGGMLSADNGVMLNINQRAREPSSSSSWQQLGLQAQQQEASGRGGSGTGDSELQSLFMDYEFANLELVKPTRMNKVYIAFSAHVLDIDLLYCLFQLPTIGICRAEQREKACQKLGVDYGLLASHFEALVPHHTPPFVSRQQADMAAVRVGAKRDGTVKPKVEDDGSSRYTGMQLQGGLGSGNDLLGGAGGFGGLGGLGLGGGPGDDDVTMGPSRSRLAMCELILEEYESTGLTRKLGQLDLQALLSQAGFPVTHTNGDHCSISAVQWDEFVTQYRAVLDLLRKIAPVWNLEDPCVISGFDMDRLGTVNALANEPAGTFICRFSMSQPGCLVLTVKATPGHPKADANGLIHAIIKVDDLNERRVDTWIRDYVGATHVLDVYRQKRVDKRKVFASNYTRLRGLEMEPELVM